jgi:hypothetical protein
MDDTAKAGVDSLEQGECVFADFKKDVDPVPRRRAHKMVRFLFDLWASRTPERVWNGIHVAHSIDDFRASMTIAAGYYKPRFSIDGSVVLESQSWAYANADDGLFRRLYPALVDVGLNKILPGLRLEGLLLREVMLEMEKYARGAREYD